jgi:predicted MPP superfamily phosphohydrolase
MEESRASAAPPQESEHAGRDFTVRRLITFALVVSTFLLLANAFVCGTAGFFFGIGAWAVWQAVPAVLALAFIASSILGFRYSHPLLRAVYGVSAAWLGALNLLFFAAVGCWIIGGIIWLTGLAVPRSVVAEILFGLALLTAIYGLINAAWLRVTQITIRWPNLPVTWQGRTAALVTDLHLGHLSGPRFLRRVIARLRSLRPDIVFLSGDLFDGTTAELDRLVAPWSDYSPPLGIHYVTGNHDEFAAREIYLEAVRCTGIRVLDNEMQVVDGMQIVGVHDSEAGDAALLRAIFRRAHIDRARPSLLLAHRPVNLAVAEEEGISLQLSGHTHKGQIWPWNLLVARIYGPFAYGLNRLGNLWVCTSSGAGTWGPPLRVATKSELVLIRFEQGEDERIAPLV